MTNQQLIVYCIALDVSHSLCAASKSNFGPEAEPIFFTSKIDEMYITDDINDIHSKYIELANCGLSISIEEINMNSKLDELFKIFYNKQQSSNYGINSLSEISDVKYNISQIF